jgi:hypothetical protein
MNWSPGLRSETCTPNTTSASAPRVTGHTEAQPAQILEAGRGAFSTGDAPGAGDGTGNGAPVGRGTKPPNASPAIRAECARLVHDAIVRGDFERAHELIDEAARLERPTSRAG